MEHESELRKRQATTPHRPVTPRLLEAQRRERHSMTASRPPQMAAQLGHFRLLKKPKRIGGAGEAIPGSTVAVYSYLALPLRIWVHKL